MKLSLLSALLGSFLLIISAGCAVRHPAPAEHWQTLFNGKDLSGWTPVGRAVWDVEDGAIVGKQDGDASRSGVLDTNEQFQDFELTLEFFLAEHGKYNSGVYLRNEPNTQRQTGYQVNIGRGVIGEYCGGVYKDGWRAKGDEKDAIRKPLAWNSMRILARGAHLEVDLNGKNVVNFTDPNATKELLQKGVISLQTYGAEGYGDGYIKFRNIKIRELPGDAPEKK